MFSLLKGFPFYLDILPVFTVTLPVLIVITGPFFNHFRLQMQLNIQMYKLKTIEDWWMKGISYFLYIGFLYIRFL